MKTEASALGGVREYETRVVRIFTIRTDSNCEMCSRMSLRIQGNKGNVKDVIDGGRERERKGLC